MPPLTIYESDTDGEELIITGTEEGQNRTD